MSPDLKAFLDQFVWPFIKAGEACKSHPPPFSGRKWLEVSQAYAKAKDALYAEWARLTRRPE